jgi:hypothetical protein
MIPLSVIDESLTVKQPRIPWWARRKIKMVFSAEVPSLRVELINHLVQGWHLGPRKFDTLETRDRRIEIELRAKLGADLLRIVGGGVTTALVASITHFASWVLLLPIYLMILSVILFCEFNLASTELAEIYLSFNRLIQPRCLWLWEINHLSCLKLQIDKLYFILTLHS